MVCIFNIVFWGWLIMGVLNRDLNMLLLLMENVLFFIFFIVNMFFFVFNDK